MGQGHAVPLAVNDGDMGGIRFFGGGEGDIDGLAGFNMLLPFLSPRLGNHPLQGNIDKIGITQVRIPVGKGGLHGHRYPVDIFG